jgi:hypothetical protein
MNEVSASLHPTPFVNEEMVQSLRQQSALLVQDCNILVNYHLDLSGHQCRPVVWLHLPLKQMQHCHQTFASHALRLAYLNLYSLVEELTGVWTCSLCGEQNLAPEALFHADHSLSKANLSLALVAPAVEHRQKVNLITPEGAIPNSQSYILEMDGNLPCDEVKAVVTTMEMLLLEQVGRGMHVQVALVIFDEAVSIYQLGITRMASADVYTPIQEDNEVSDEESLIQRRLRMENRSYFVRVTSTDDLATLWLCLSAVYGIQVQQVNGGSTEQSSQEGEPLSRKEKLRLRKEARLRKELSGSLEQDLQISWNLFKWNRMGNQG